MRPTRPGPWRRQAFDIYRDTLTAGVLECAGVCAGMVWNAPEDFQFSNYPGTIGRDVIESEGIRASWTSRQGDSAR